MPTKSHNTEEKESIKIVSYNIHNGFYNFDESENTFYDMCKWLNKQKADVVLFQEVTFREISKAKFEKQMKQMGFEFIAYGFADDLYGKDGGNFFGQATCSKIPFQGKQIVLNLKRDPVNNEGRCALFMNVQGLTICNTHLDVFDRTGKTRLTQIKQIDKVLNDYNLFPAMVCGDFNTQRRQDYTAKQWSAIKTNPWNIASSGKSLLETLALDYIASMEVRDVLDIVGKKSSTSVPGATRRIDFMFSFDPFDQLVVESAEINKKVRFSDHFPVIATVHLQ